MRLFPHYTRYADNLPNGFKGSAFGPVINIVKSSKEDKALWEHEYTHVKQFWTCFLIILVLGVIASYVINNYNWVYISILWGLLFHMLLYKAISKYRLWAEVSAYTNQLEYIGEHRPDDLSNALSVFAKHISTKYNLKITYDQAYSRLEKAIGGLWNIG